MAAGTNMTDVLTRLDNILRERKTADPSQSYVASLYAGGEASMLGKIGEEAAEVIAAGRSADMQAIVHEVADLWFHTLVLLAHKGLGPEHILAELERRFGRSGLDEKAARLRE